MVNKINMKKSFWRKKMRSTFNLCNFARLMGLKSPIDTGMVLVLLIIIFQMSGCSMAQRPSSAEPEFERNRKLWRENKITSYNFVMSRDGGGTLIWVPVFVKVRGTETISMEPTRELSVLDKIEGYENFDTVEKCFERIHESYNRGEKTKVTYNKELGYPEKIIFDPKQGAVDTLYSINISKFEVVRN